MPRPSQQPTAVHCLTELFPIYQIKHRTTRQRNDRSIDLSCLTVLYWRLSDFNIWIGRPYMNWGVFNGVSDRWNSCTWKCWNQLLSSYDQILLIPVIYFQDDWTQWLISWPIQSYDLRVLILDGIQETNYLIMIKSYWF